MSNSASRIFHDFDFRAAADHLVAILDGGDAPHIRANRRVELQRATAGCRFRIAEHDADLFANLVDEDEAGFGFRNDAGEFAQGLGHQSGLQAHLCVAHFAFELGARDECGNRVDNDDVDGAAADQDFGDFEGLLAAVRLRDEKVFDIDSELARVIRV